MPLFFDLIISAAMLCYIGSIPWLKRLGATGVLIAAGSGLYLAILCLFNPVLLLNALTLGGVAAVYLSGGLSRRAFWAASLAAIVPAYLIVSLFVLMELHSREPLRKRYPLESMAVRLPREVQRTDVAVRPFANGRLSEVEAQTSKAMSHIELNWRRDMLEMLHQSFVRQFVGSPGFGMMRSIAYRSPSETAIELYAAESEFLEQPANSQSAPLNEENESTPKYEAFPLEGSFQQALWSAHRNALVDFVNVRGFGYVRDREHVAGFRPHGIRDSPLHRDAGIAFNVEAGDSNWKLLRLELISLLKFDEPRVYVTPGLPRMGRLGDGRTRPVDTIEETALTALKEGDDLFAARTGEALRVVGSIRAGIQCITCHAVQRGELLGAFSYDLRREGKTLPETSPVSATASTGSGRPRRPTTSDAQSAP